MQAFHQEWLGLKNFFERPAVPKGAGQWRPIVSGRLPVAGLPEKHLHLSEQSFILRRMRRSLVAKKNKGVRAACTIQG
jgi:hypothetical protein